jgi:hypothetical protein
MRDDAAASSERSRRLNSAYLLFIDLVENVAGNTENQEDYVRLKGNFTTAKKSDQQHNMNEHVEPSQRHHYSLFPYYRTYNSQQPLAYS